MPPILARTLGALALPYYLRHFAFGLLFPLFAYVMAGLSPQPMHYGMVLMFALNTVLYPYSRFVYEGVMAFILGDNLIVAGLVAMLLVKLLTMTLCWLFAIFVAPVGLLYLYFDSLARERRS